ncbi:hypothetical protein M422DRAFT_277285 [Sphaerobolus stellatus SS14]|uniref:Uncharacterized protein n=1 Tax=Sphaerobolus stellatus (strain SS14) TaxID=990650 RepID=A0A0C9U057_SPHS4|nr:hypothetical protein M422DRAFT_277285 [Sphaerobolus stellatus SS14]
MEQDDDSVIQLVTSTHGKCKQHQKDPQKILEELRKPENYPQPETWEDILSFWTINQIQDTFHALAFQPHKSHWKGLPKGSKQLSFGERLKSFFPPLETEFSTSSVWYILKAIGYLKNYHIFLSTKPEHDILSLQDHLRAAFDLLECLPDKAAGINTQPWKYHPDKGGPSFIVNAKAYKIRGVGPPKKNTSIPHPRAIATHTRIEALLLADNLNINFNDTIKHTKGNNQQAQKQAKHSAKHRNKRKPPQVSTWLGWMDHGYTPSSQPIIGSSLPCLHDIR